jgi:hypothetical protein
VQILRTTAAEAGLTILQAASARGETTPGIAMTLSGDEQTVRHAIHAFNNE